METGYKHIKPVTFTADQSGPHLLIIAAIHGDEHEPVHAVRQLVRAFSDDLKLVEGSLTLIPVANGPAYEKNSRTGPDGLDLARTCPGDGNGSVTQQIAREISEMIRSADYLIDMHTGGQVYEIYPLAGYMLHPDAEVLEKQRLMARTFGLPVQWGTSPHLEGRTLSVARDACIPAIYTEYGGGGNKNPKIVDALYSGCLGVMNGLKMIQYPDINLPGPSYVVEDFREGSGHLQILYPSPIDGQFTTTIGLGEVVKAGRQIGRVVASSSGEEAGICAREDGLLFLIRRQADVQKGESTAGILPIIQPGKMIIT